MTQPRERRENTAPPQPDPHSGSHPAEAGGPHTAPRAVDFVAVRDGEEFSGLRRRFRSFAFPMTIAFVVWYLSYVLCSTFAEDLMATPVLGNLNVGLLWGLSQFLTTFVITGLYIRHADKNLDPITRSMRREMAQAEGKL